MDYWILVDNIYNVTLSLSFFVLTVLMFYIGRKGIKVQNKSGGVTTIICGFCFLIFGYYNSIMKFFPYPYNGFMVWWIGIILLVSFSFFALVKREIRRIETETEERVLKNGKKPILRRYIDRIRKLNPYQADVNFKMELIRKSFHLMGFLLLMA